MDLFPPALKAYHNRIFVGSGLGCDCGFSFCMHIETLLLTISVKIEPVALLMAVFNHFSHLGGNAEHVIETLPYSFFLPQNPLQLRSTVPHVRSTISDV
jgi:hypothetical protein